MLTSPITNDHFHTRVLGLLNAYTQNLAGSAHTQSQPLPLIPALDNLDTPLGPSDTIGQLVIFTSSWIDLSSPDPVIAHLSRQVFHLEIAYAAFCGATNVVVSGPRLSHGQNGISRYARAVKEALSTAAYMQLHIQLPIDGTVAAANEDDLGDLARFARAEFEQSKESNNNDPWSSWDAWNTVRSICKYHNRLSVGTNNKSLSMFLKFDETIWPFAGTRHNLSLRWTNFDFSFGSPTPTSVAGSPVTLVF